VISLSECLSSWPPIVTIGKVAMGGGINLPPHARLDDVVTNARSVSPHTINLDLHNREREEYSISLPIDSSVQARVLTQIAMQRRISLREVGELPIS
jgi:hypothetical protein